MENLISKLLSLGIFIEAKENNLEIIDPNNEITDDIIAQIKDNKAKLLSILNSGIDSVEYKSIKPAVRKCFYKLSSAQKRMYFLYEFDKNSLEYNMPSIVKLEGNLDKDKLTNAFKKLISRHEILRTSFELFEGKIVQKVSDEEGIVIEHMDSKIDKVPGLIQDFIRPFNLKHPHLIRVGLIVLSDEEHVLMIDMHHIISDGVSRGLLIKDFMSLYNNEELPTLELQYKDYAEWQQGEKQQNNLVKQKKFWINEFAEEKSMLELPTDYKRPKVKSGVGNSERFILSQLETSSLKSIVDGEGASLYMGLLAIFNILLSKLSNQEDILIGSPVAGRQHADLEGIIGLFVNSIAICNYPRGELSFSEFLMEVKAKTLVCFENQSYQFEDLVDELHLERDMSRHPLFDIMFVLQNNEGNSLSFPDLSLSPYEIKQEISKFDLTLFASESEGKVLMNFEYSTSLFRRETIEKFISYFGAILTAVISDPHTRISGIEILSKSEKCQLLNEFNDTKLDYPKEKTVIDLFEEQVEKNTKNIALIFEDKKVSYEELNNKANIVSASISKKLSYGQHKIGVLFDPSIELIISILGVLKSDNIYIPLSHELPLKRINYILQDSEIKLLLLDENNVNKDLYALDRTEVLTVQQATILEENICCTKRKTSTADLMYIIYTSGTTGNPKGVGITYEGISNMLFFYKHLYNIREGMIMSQVANICFDASIFEIFPCLANGCSLIIAPSETRFNPVLMKDWLVSNHVEITYQSTAVAEYLLKLDWRGQEGQLKLMNIAGDKLTYFPKHRLPFDVYNLYGPTEDTIWTTWTKLTQEEINLENYIIGRPISNKKVIITDKYNNLQPIGVSGELCISGVGLSRGYINNKKLTDEKFIDNPYEMGAKLYKTGDLARWLPDGTIEFLGRLDYQVKIRGFRIELGEIEKQLVLHDKIKEAVVLARERKNDKYLVAYYVSEEKLEVSELREFLSLKLPSYMEPSYFMFLENMPLTLNGKINRKALPDSEFTAGEDYVGPSNQTEEKLVKIWSEVLVLNSEDISVIKSFFELGGHSLKAIDLINKIFKELHIEVSLKELFEYQNIRNLGNYLHQLEKTEYTFIKPTQIQPYYQLSSAQKRMYFLHEFDKESLAYNMPYTAMLEGELDKDKLTIAFNKLIIRHEILRTNFEVISGVIVQKIIDDIDFTIEYVNSNIDNIPNLIKAFVRRFDLNQAPMIRVGLIGLSGREHVLMVDMHHIVSDGVSSGLLINDFMLLYNGEELPTLKLQYKDYAEWQQGQNQQDKLEKHKDFWLQEFSEEHNVLELSTDYNRPSLPSYKGDAIDFELSLEVTNKLKRIIVEEGTTMFMSLLSIFNILLGKLSNQEDIVVGSTVAGRQHSDFKSVIGIFVNTLPLRNYPKGGLTFKEFMLNVKSNTLSCFDHQSYQYEDLIDLLKLERNTSRNPLFDVMFDLNNTEKTGLRLPCLLLKPYKAKTRTSQFDLTLSAFESGETIMMRFVYSTSLFTAKTIEKFIDYYKTIVFTVVEDVNIKLKDITIHSESDKHQLLHEFNDTKVNYPREETFVDLFTRASSQFPSNIAVSDKKEQLSYAELDALSNRIAHFIKSKKLVKGQIIPLLLERGIPLIAFMTGIQKAGYVFVALDVSLPKIRLLGMIEDCQAKLVITETNHQALLAQEPQAHVEDMDIVVFDSAVSLNDLFQEYPTTAIETRLGPDDITYLIYTSGSTGKPKGVLLHQQGMVNHFRGLVELMGLNAKDIFAQTAECSFDIFVVQSLLLLITGGKTFIVARDEMLDPGQFSGLINDEGITVIELVPTVLKYLLDHDDFLVTKSNLRWLISCGEKLTTNLTNQWYTSYPDVKIINAYGPAEASDDVSAYEVPSDIPADENNMFIPIGKPLPNVTMYILDKDLGLCPIGARGEICISGISVGKGYWRNEQETRSKFVPNPYLKDVGEDTHPIIYRTGDIGYWQEDGNIVFLGRMDSMVKVRGARVELGEIENSILLLKGIEETVVILKEAQLCAYYVSSSGQEIQNIRDLLVQSLPDFMLPSYFIHLETIPLTPNGKIDRKLLPDPELNAGEDYEAPSNEIEEKLVRIWSEILGIDKELISVNKNFFDLGGHSLKALILSNKIIKELGAKLKLKDLFIRQTIIKQAEFIELDNWLLNEEEYCSDGQEIII